MATNRGASLSCQLTAGTAAEDITFSKVKMFSVLFVFIQ